jgi:hypothetical protein
MIERVRIKELLAIASHKRRRKVTQTELAAHVFSDDISRPKFGVRGPISDTRKQQLMWQWDTGAALTSMKPRHLLRMARFFGIYDVRKLLDFDPAGGPVNPEEGD